MKISLKWVRDYVDLPEDAEEIARRLTMAGLEIEGIHRQAAALEGVVVAQVKEAQPHPNADKLQVTQIDAGRGTPLQVVCGAKNFKVGDKVPLAMVGASLPNGMSIGEASLRGVPSSGMLCSSKELGLSSDSAGLLILDPELKIGAPLSEVLGLDDVIFEVNVTPNRPDALSHLGIARELSVLFGTPLKVPEVKIAESGSPAASKIQVKIEDPVRCPRYAARVIENVTIGPSPRWIAERLEACGMRAINNVVDVTNYVMLECGQPLHGFDLEHVGGSQIVVRTARAGEKMTTLDGKERALSEDDLLVADAERGQVIAGVMGGADSEVSEKTRHVLLEAANFQASSVRRSSKRHALHTESSHRFERGADVQAIDFAIHRAAALIAELGKGTVTPGLVDVYPKRIEPRRVTLRFAYVSELLGVEIPEAESRRILEMLGFKKESEKAGEVMWIVPTVRVDVDRAEDLIEEIARVRGYNNIPNRLPRGLAELAPEPASSDVERRIRQALSGVGIDEAVNYAFVAPQLLSALGDEGPYLTVKNPLSVEQSVMRSTVLAGLVENLQRNVRHQSRTVRLYELAKSFHRDPEGGQGTRPATRERRVVAGLLWGAREVRGWTAAQKDVALDFYDAKGAVEAVLSVINIRGAQYVAVRDVPALHPRAAAEVRDGEGRVLGVVGQLHPRASRALEVPAETFVFELDLDALEASARLVPQASPLPRFPAVLRDLAVVVPHEQHSEDLRKIILEIGAPLVEDAMIFDVYTGHPVPEGRKNLAYAIRYRAADRTLTDQEVVSAHQRIVDEVNKRVGGTLRS